MNTQPDSLYAHLEPHWPEFCAAFTKAVHEAVEEVGRDVFIEAMCGASSRKPFTEAELKEIHEA
jgi:hypothetical protein